MLTFEQIKELIELVAMHRLGGVEVERSGFRIKIDGLPPTPTTLATPSAVIAGGPLGVHPSWALAAGGADASGAAGVGGAALAASPAGLGGGAAVATGTAPAPASPGGAAAGTPPAAERSPTEGSHVINSPIVGTFYRASSPEAAPFVEVGSRVQKGQVLCIIEAMKLMNEIESDVAGVVVAVLPQNAQAVEFGEPLFAVKPG